MASGAGSGCGDAPLCPREPYVAVLQSVIASDLDDATPGTQTDVQVLSSLREGEDVTLEVLTVDRVVQETLRQPVEASGVVVFRGVTVPAPRVVLHATGHGVCGEASEEQTVDVLAGGECALALSPAPELVAHYAPFAVLSTRTDPDPLTPGYQATVQVTTRPGWSTEIFQLTAGEQSIGVVTADAAGVASLPITVLDGRVGFRAICRGPATERASLTTTVVADTTPPGCSLVAPAPGSTITPGLDTNHDLGDGVQLAIAAHADGDDVVGEPVSLAITDPSGAVAEIPASATLATGGAMAAATLLPATTPAQFYVALTMQDHAGNRCMATATYDVVYDGCDIAVTSPTAPVTRDSNGTGADGSQLDVTLAVAPACAGQTVTATCGAGSPSALVEPDGRAVLRLDVCATSPCEAELACAFRVTTPSGVETEAAATLVFDDQGPEVTAAVVSPALACGAQVTPAVDVEPAIDGVQIVVRVSAPAASGRTLEVTGDGRSTVLDATGDVLVTLASGSNQLIGAGLDALGNVGRSAACVVALADLSVSFAAPAAGGVIARADGNVAGSAITFPLCGTTSRSGASVSVAVDGGAPAPATVTGTTWCRDITLAESPPSHTLVVVAAAGASFGSSTLVVRVDLTPAAPVVELSAVAIDRQRIRLTWIAPADGAQPVAGYVLKTSPVPLTEATFDAAGSVVAAVAPAPPGSVQTLDVAPVRIGAPQAFAIAALDDAGNRSTIAVAGPIVPAFAQTGAILPINAKQGALGLGSAIAHGRFNDDDFDDVAIAAPTQNAGAVLRAGAVYVYFGSAQGLAALPDLTITSAELGARLGSGLTAVRWGNASRDDLVIGAPGADGGAGRIFVLRGGNELGLGTRPAASAELQISVSPAQPGWFAGGGLGSGLATADVDGDGTVDLIAAAPQGGGGGGAVILYGDTVTGDVVLSDVDPAPASGAIVELFADPGATTGRQLGFYLHAVGPTQGALDATDDFVIAYADDYATAGDSLYVVRGDGTRPTSPGVTARPFAPGRDVRLDLATTSKVTEWASQVTSLDDQDGDGARELVIGAYRERNGHGQVLIVAGDVLGSAGVARTSDPGVTLTTINTVATDSRFGAAIAAHDQASHADIDGDGREDLIIGGQAGIAGTGFVWFGGAIPAGVITTASAQAELVAPSTMRFQRQSPQGFAGQARWIGDINHDGLDDVCWASPFDNAGDGSFEVLFDTR